MSFSFPPVRCFRRFLLALLVAAPLLAPLPASAQDAYQIRGRILDSGTRAPVPGAQVTLRGTELGTSTDASGSFELNVQIPVMGTALLESIRLLANSVRVLADKTVDGLQVNEERTSALAGMSPSIVTPLNKIIGYEAAAKIAKHSVAKGITVRRAFDLASREVLL